VAKPHARGQVEERDGKGQEPDIVKRLLSFWLFDQSEVELVGDMDDQELVLRMGEDYELWLDFCKHFHIDEQKLVGMVENTGPGYPGGTPLYTREEVIKWLSEVLRSGQEPADLYAVNTSMLSKDEKGNVYLKPADPPKCPAHFVHCKHYCEDSCNPKPDFTCFTSKISKPCPHCGKYPDPNQAEHPGVGSSAYCSCIREKHADPPDCDKCIYGPLRIQGEYEIGTCKRFQMADQCYQFGYTSFKPKDDPPAKVKCEPCDGDNCDEDCLRWGYCKSPNKKDPDCSCLTPDVLFVEHACWECEYWDGDQCNDLKDAAAEECRAKGFKYFKPKDDPPAKEGKQP